MIVISDASPLRYLILIDEVDLLPALFKRVLLPSSVALELQNPRTPAKVRVWMQTPPGWLIPTASRSSPSTPIAGLGAGESEAIQIAVESREPALILIDEIKGRRAAESIHARVIGTVGLLEQAAILGLVDLRAALNKLRATNFRISSAVLADLLARNPPKSVQ
jgi:predicted nucleic acid-binding protein